MTSTSVAVRIATIGVALATTPPAHASKPASAESSYVIFDAKLGKNLFLQCSRSTPTAANYWTPGPADIAKLESALPAALPPVSNWRGKVLSNAPQGWLRQYVGFLRGGRRFIYGNFFPDTPDERAHWRHAPIMVCDGGPAFFGVEFDANRGVITDVEFNGEG